MCLQSDDTFLEEETDGIWLAIPHTSGQSLGRSPRSQHSQVSNSITRLSHTTNVRSPSKAARNVVEDLRPKKAAKSRGRPSSITLNLSDLAPRFISQSSGHTPQAGSTFIILTFGKKRIQIQLPVINSAIQSSSEQPVSLNSPDS